MKIQSVYLFTGRRRYNLNMSNFDSIDGLAGLLGALAEKGQRFLLGITGPPGSGKSTLSSELKSRVLDSGAFKAEVVPMDGFHLPNEVLEERKLRALKGVPETFDAEGFVSLIERLRHRGSDVSFPTFDRDQDAVIEEGGTVAAEIDLIIVEGNYLLLPSMPWYRLRHYLNTVWFVEAARDVLLERLVARHVSGGMTPDQARKKVSGTDLPNASLIDETRQSCGRVIRLPENLGAIQS